MTGKQLNDNLYKMKPVIDNFFQTLIQRNEWLFITAILALSLYQLSDDSWLTYSQLIAKNAIIIGPFIVLTMLQNNSKASMLLRINGPFWWCLSTLYPSLIVFSSMHSLLPLSVSDAVLFLSSILIIQFLLLFELLYRKHTIIDSLARKITLNKLLLLFASGISIYLALFIVSDLNLWRTSNSLGESITWSTVLTELPMAISLVFQLFLLFFCGFLFIWINQFFLVKQVLAKRGILFYLLASLGTVLLLYPVLMELYLLLPINRMGEPIIPAVLPNPFDWANGRVFLAAVLTSFPVIVSIRWHQQNKRLVDLEKEQTKSELNLLKQQLNPHFLLNTLNNLYALCRKKSDLAPEVVLQLSELMQYVVYRSQDGLVKLDEEIAYLDDYISLQSIRSKAQSKISKRIEVDCSSVKVAPLLFIILVENAFKHGDELSSKQPWLSIDIEVKGNQLVFCCENVYEPGKQDSHQGVGLANLKRRLLLIYPNAHNLMIEKTEQHFKAILQIALNGYAAQ